MRYPVSVGYVTVRDNLAARRFDCSSSRWAGTPMPKIEARPEEVGGEHRQGSDGA